MTKKQNKSKLKKYYIPKFNTKPIPFIIFAIIILSIPVISYYNLKQEEYTPLPINLTDVKLRTSPCQDIDNNSVCIKLIEVIEDPKIRANNEYTFLWRHKNVNKVSIGYKTNTTKIIWIDYNYNVNPNQTIQNYTWKNIPEFINKQDKLNIYIIGWADRLANEFDELEIEVLKIN